MQAEEFERVVAEVLDKVPAKFAQKLKNIAVLVEDGEWDGPNLGLYQGVALTERGDAVPLLPDTITLYRLPILHEAEASGLPIAQVVQDTVWHEIAHYFGMDEEGVHTREDEGTNRYAE